MASQATAPFMVESITGIYDPELGVIVADREQVSSLEPVVLKHPQLFLPATATREQKVAARNALTEAAKAEDLYGIAEAERKAARKRAAWAREATAMEKEAARLLADAARLRARR